MRSPCPSHPHRQVKRDAVAGLASLAKSDANKEVMGKMGALAALIELVFKDDKNPTAFVTDRGLQGGGGGRASTGTTRRFRGTDSGGGHHHRVGTETGSMRRDTKRYSLDGQPSLEDLSQLPSGVGGAGAATLRTAGSVGTSIHSLIHSFKPSIILFFNSTSLITPV